MFANVRYDHYGRLAHNIASHSANCNPPQTHQFHPLDFGRQILAHDATVADSQAHVF